MTCIIFQVIHYQAAIRLLALLPVLPAYQFYKELMNPGSILAPPSACQLSSLSCQLISCTKKWSSSGAFYTFNCRACFASLSALQGADQPLLFYQTAIWQSLSLLSAV
jgi:hypothetical protein